MPSRPLSPEEHDYYRSQGIDSTHFVVDLPDELTPSNSSVGGSALRGAASAAIPTAAGGLGFGAGAALGAEAGAFGGPAAPITVPAGALIGGLIAAAGSSFAAAKAQEAMMPDQWKQQLADDQKEHPYASAAGQLATLPLGGFSPSTTALREASQFIGGKLVSKAVPTTAVSEAVEGAVTKGSLGKQALVNVAAGAGLGAVQEAGMEKLRGEDLSAGSIAEGALIGGLFNKVNRFGEAYNKANGLIGLKPGFHALPERPITAGEGEVFESTGTGQSVAPAVDKAAVAAVPPSPVADYRNDPQIRAALNRLLAPVDTTTQQLPIKTVLPQRKPKVVQPELPVVPAAKTSDIVPQAPEVAPESELHDLFDEPEAAVEPEIPKAPEPFEVPEAPLEQVSKPLPKVEVTDATLPDDVTELVKIANDPAAAPERQQQAYAKVKMLLTGTPNEQKIDTKAKLTPAAKAEVTGIVKANGATVTEDPTLPAHGVTVTAETTNPVTKAVTKNKEVIVNPTNERVDTRSHEGSHLLWDEMPDEFKEVYGKLVKDKFEKWKFQREQWNKEHPDQVDTEHGGDPLAEYFARNTGAGVIRRASEGKFNGWKNWLDDIKRHVKIARGTATLSDLEEATIAQAMAPKGHFEISSQALAQKAGMEMGADPEKVKAKSKKDAERRLAAAAEDQLVRGDTKREAGAAGKEEQRIKGIDLTPANVDALNKHVAVFAQKLGVSADELAEMQGDALVHIAEHGFVLDATDPSVPDYKKTYQKAADAAKNSLEKTRRETNEFKSLDDEEGTVSHSKVAEESQGNTGDDTHVDVASADSVKADKSPIKVSAAESARNFMLKAKERLEDALEEADDDVKDGIEVKIAKLNKAIEGLSKKKDSDDVDFEAELKKAGLEAPKGFKYQKDESIPEEIARRMKDSVVQEDVFHSTVRDFERADPQAAKGYKAHASMFGMHFGTAEQAERRAISRNNDRLLQTMREGQTDIKEPRTGKYKIVLKKPYDVDDMEANFPNALRNKMHTDGLLSDEEYRDMGAMDADERASYMVDRLKERGYDGMRYDNEAEGKGKSYVVFDRDQIINTIAPKRSEEGTVYQKDETPAQFNIRQALHRQFIGERRPQKKIFAQFGGEAPNSIGTYYADFGKGVTRRVNDTGTATHEAVHTWFDDNLPALASLVHNADLTLEDVASAFKALQQHGGYKDDALELYQAISRAITKHGDENTWKPVKAKGEVISKLYPVLNELAAQYAHPSDGVPRARVVEMHERTKRLMNKVFGEKFTRDFTNLIANEGAIGRSKWNSRTHNYYQKIEDPVNRFNFLGVKPALEVAEQKSGNKEVANAFRAFYPLKDEYFAKYFNPVYDAAKKASALDKKKVLTTMYREDMDGVSYRSELNGTQRKIYDVVRNTLKQQQLDQIEAGEMVRYMDSNGNRAYRLPEVNETYMPSLMRPDVLDTLVNKKAGYREIQKRIYDHLISQGSSAEGADAKIQVYMNSGLTGKSNQTRFGANRLAEGLGLPLEYRVQDFDKMWERYVRHKSTDRAFYDAVEAKDTVMRALNPKRPENVNREFHPVIESITGETFDRDASVYKSANRVATSLMLGPLTNIHILGSTVFNPMQYMKATEVGPMYGRALANLAQARKDTIETGYARHDLNTVKDIFEGTNTAVQKMAAVASLVGKVNGRQWSDIASKTFAQALGNEIVPRRIADARTGNKYAVDMMKHLDPEWSADKQYTSAEVKSLASVLGGYIHGHHDSRTLPSWMTHDSWIQPFFSLMSWSTAQTNMWMRHVWEPAKKGNIEPLLMSALGATLGGYVIKELREKLSNKKGNIPTLDEIAKSSKGVEGNIPLLAYNFMQMASYTGFAGLGSMIGKDMFDMAYKNIPQGATFPLDETAANLTRSIAHATAAWMQTPDSKTFFDIMPRLMADVTKDNMQTARIAWNWAADSKNAPEYMSEQFESSKQRGNLRRFRIAEGLPYNPQLEGSANPYMNMPYKKFKETQDMKKAVGEVPEVIAAARDRAKGNPEVLKQQLQSAKTTSYQTMPSPENMPMQFTRYYQYLVKTQGQEEAQRIMKDYMQHNMINKAKASMIP